MSSKWPLASPIVSDPRERQRGSQEIFMSYTIASVTCSLEESHEAQHTLREKVVKLYFMKGRVGILDVFLNHCRQ